MYPDGQLQVTLCDLTSHTAFVAHGLATMHGLRQALSLQISLSPQSRLELHPDGGGGAKKFVKINLMHYRTLLYKVKTIHIRYNH